MSGLWCRYRQGSRSLGHGPSLFYSSHLAREHPEKQTDCFERKTHQRKCLGACTG
jgi:hypothetical protein